MMVTCKLPKYSLPKYFWNISNDGTEQVAQVCNGYE